MTFRTQSLATCRPVARRASRVTRAGPPHRPQATTPIVRRAEDGCGVRAAGPAKPVALRILIVNRNCVPSRGGIQTYIDLLGRRLIAQGVEVAVVATQMSPATSANGVPYRVLYGPSWRQAWTLLRWATIVQFSVFDYWWWVLAKLLGKRTIFIYHSHARICPKGVSWNGNETCSFATHWRRCPACLHQDRSWLATAMLWLSLPIKQRLADGADAIVNISRYTERRFQIPRSRTIPHGIDVQRFRPIDTPSRDYVLFVGRLIPEKGVQVLLEAFTRCVAGGLRVRLVIAGDGPQRAELEAMARREGIAQRVEFLGALDATQVLGLLQHALAVVVPSIAPETWGRTAVEAMACGTPVIAASSGALEETVGEAGLLYPPLDRAALAERMTRLSNDAGLQQRLQSDGRALVEARYDIGRMTAQYLALYRELSVEAAST